MNSNPLFCFSHKITQINSTNWSSIWFPICTTNNMSFFIYLVLIMIRIIIFSPILNILSNILSLIKIIHKSFISSLCSNSSKNSRVRSYLTSKFSCCIKTTRIISIHSSIIKLILNISNISSFPTIFSSINI